MDNQTALTFIAVGILYVMPCLLIILACMHGYGQVVLIIVGFIIGFILLGAFPPLGIAILIYLLLFRGRYI